LAHLRVLVNPLDTISWTRMLTLIDKIGPKTSNKIIQQLQQEAEEERDPFTYLAGYPQKTKYAYNLQRLGGVLESIRPLLPFEQVQNLLAYYLPIMREKYRDNKTDKLEKDHKIDKREQELEQLGVIIERFDNLQDFLAEVTLEPPNQSVDDVMQTTTEDEYLVLSTIHSAKGLEWHSVFVIWLLDGRFPSMYAANDDESLQEELRLLYVAATRAMHNLYLSYPVYYDSRAGMFFSKPSRFLDNIPEDCLERWSLRDENERHWEDWA
jgi:DNA helicase-2/ATP-dependent DNA helicase PcrA